MALESRRRLKFSILTGHFAVCRLPAESVMPAWAELGSFVSVTRTPEELSIVCPYENVPKEERPESTWTCLKLQGPFAFTETGILGAFLEPLAMAGVGIFAISTYDTDYVLIQQQNIERGLAALQDAGHELVTGTG